MKVLLTGFGPFGGLKVNSSQLVVESLSTRQWGSIDLISEVLPTEYEEAGRRIIGLIRDHCPELIICLGLAVNTKSIHLERVALNLDDADSPDNAGVVRRGRFILSEGPAAYWSTLPIEELARQLTRQGIPVIVSNHAGAFVCNHVFYLSRHESERLRPETKCGFMHLPPLFQPGEAVTPKECGLPLDMMVKAVETCLSHLAPQKIG